MTGSKGARHERELANRLADEGWAVIRSPASGSVDRPQPDLLASHPDRRPVAAELKYASDDRIYLSLTEGRDLCAFATAYDALAVAIFRWAGDIRYYPRRIAGLSRTDAGSFVADHDTARAAGWQDGTLPNAVLGINTDAEADATYGGQR